MITFTSYLPIICVLIHSTTGIVSTLQFCSESSINNNFENLTLDGSYAVQSSVSQSCRCTVTPLDPPPSSFRLFNELSTSTTSRECNTKLDVFRSNGSLVHSMHCEQTGIQVDTEDMDAGLLIYLHVFADTDILVPKQYKLHIMPDVKSQLIVHCSPGTEINEPPGSIVSPLPSSSTTSSPSSSTTSTSPTPVLSGSNDTAVIVGVVIGLGFFMLVFISCLLCYIARRSKNDNHIPQIAESPQEHRTTQHHNILQRTLTRARDRIMQARPLPQIPASLRKFTLRRKVIDRDNQSGYYASIRSENSNGNKISGSNIKTNVINDQVAKQLSVESGTSYIHPNEVNTSNSPVVGMGFSETNRQKVVNTISDTVAKKDDRDYLTVPRVSNVNIQEVDNKCDEQLKPKVNIIPHGTMPQQKSANVNSRLKEDDSGYILPNDEQITKMDYVNTKSVDGHVTQHNGRFGTSGNFNLDSHAEYLSLQNNTDYANVGLKRTDEDIYLKEKSINSLAGNPCEINTSQINTACVDASGDHTYLPMQGVPNKISKSTHKEEDVNIVKETLRDTDSAGYMSMSNCTYTKDTHALKKMDSTFPNMISFRAHGEVDQHENSSNAEYHAINNNFKQNKNKVKRYIKDNQIP